MAKALTPPELFDRINDLFVHIYDIQENTINELKELGVSEEAARILTDAVIRQQIDNYFGGFNKWT